MQDKAGAVNVRRWRIFRSTVAFALQETFPLDFLFILWQPSQVGHAKFLDRTISDIRDRIADRKRNLAIQAVPVDFDEPFNLQENFRVLWETLQSEVGEDSQVFFNLNNGTHTMQMAMFLLAKYRPVHRPIELLQVFRDRGIPDQKASCTHHAQAHRLDLRWENLQPLERQIRKEKAEIREAIFLKSTRHPEVDRLYQEIVDIGCFTDDLLLLTGPTGSGKSRIAEEIHHGWAKRKNQPRAPFFELNAAGLSGDLIRSTLFGHTRGSFTGATEYRDGFLLAANRGTLFLDEIGELDLRSQAELLLAIETKTFFPVGSTVQKTSDFRLICATNRDLRQMVQGGSFREDLYTRIRCWEFTLPGVRELPLDFDENIHFELKQCNSEEFRKGNSQPFQVFFDSEAKKQYIRFCKSPEALWTGNFRDLKFSIRRMFVKAQLKESPITKEIVAEELNRLRDAWSLQQPRVGFRADVFPSGLEATVRAAFPELHLLDAIEAFLIKTGFEKTGNKAGVGRWLYEIPGKKLPNPSNRFRERFQSLFGKNSLNLLRKP